jgi:thymidylate synthase
MNALDKQYTDLLQDILDNGVTKQTRNGGTLSVFGRQIRHSMKDGFPLLTTKKMAWKSIVTELLWFLRGDTNIKYLVDNGCHIWDGDAIKNWISSGKCYRFRRNLYIEPKFEILSVDEVNPEDFPYINSDGIYGKEKDGIEELWVDFSKFKAKYVEKFISDGFVYKIKTDDRFAKQWGELGPIYGKQWRDWGSKRVSKRFYDKKIPYSKFVQEGGIDQIANLINDLKNNPDSRRLMVNVWNVGELDQMVLPPCHYGFQVYTRELSAKERWDWYGKNGGPMGEQKLVALIVHENEEDNSHIHSWLKTWAPNVPTRAISLMWNQRSVDTFLGLPFNIASYGLLLEIIAKEVNMVPDELIGNLGDVHLYSNHIEQAKEQIGREPYPLPKLLFKDHLKSFDTIIDILRVQDFILDNYQSHPSIKAPLSN